MAALIALALILPGAATTAVQLPPYLGGTYGSFSNVSAADFALLAWCGAHFAPGDRVLVAPGSIGEFVPGYAPRIVLLFPMMANYPAASPWYPLVVDELASGTLDTAGRAGLAALNVTWVLVTQNNSVLYPAFSPAPLLADSGFAVTFHQADAYAFERTGPP